MPKEPCRATDGAASRTNSSVSQCETWDGCFDRQLYCLLATCIDQSRTTRLLARTYHHLQWKWFILQNTVSLCPQTSPRCVLSDFPYFLDRCDYSELILAQILSAKIEISLWVLGGVYFLDLLRFNFISLQLSCNAVALIVLWKRPLNNALLWFSLFPQSFTLYFFPTHFANTLYHSPSCPVLQKCEGGSHASIFFRKIRPLPTHYISNSCFDQHFCLHGESRYSECVPLHKIQSFRNWFYKIALRFCIKF